MVKSRQSAFKFREPTRSDKEIAEAMDQESSRLQTMQTNEPLARHEWLGAFFGPRNLGKKYRDFARALERVQMVRHSLGSPYMYLGAEGFTRTVGVIGRPQNYDPYNAESFFSYRLHKTDEHWVGDVACRAFIIRSRGTFGEEYSPTEDSSLVLLSVKRPFGQTEPDGFSTHLYSDTTSSESGYSAVGYVIGFEAISKVAASRLSDHPNMWPRRAAEERLRKIYHNVGELVMTPKTGAAD